MKKVAIYLRVSTEGLKGGREQTTGSQRTEIEAYLKSKAISEFEVYEDVGISGRKKDRAALNKLLKDCKSGKVSMVVVYKLDRVARSLSHLLEIVTDFKNWNIEFISVKDSLNMDTATGMLMFSILGAFAEFEAATIKERVMSGLANARAKGVKLGRPFKTGHSVVGKLKEEGKSVFEISEITGLSTKTVYRNLKQGEKYD